MNLMTTAQAAKLFSVSTRTIQMWCANKTLPSIRVKKTTRIIAEQMPAYIAGFHMDMLLPQSQQILDTQHAVTDNKKAA